MLISSPNNLGSGPYTALIVFNEISNVSGFDTLLTLDGNTYSFAVNYGGNFTLSNGGSLVTSSAIAFGDTYCGAVISNGTSGSAQLEPSTATTGTVPAVTGVSGNDSRCMDWRILLERHYFRSSIVFWCCRIGRCCHGIFNHETELGNAVNNPFFDIIQNVGKQLLSRAANGAAEALLDEVHGAVKEVDRRISKAKKRAASYRTKEEPEIEVMEGEVVK